MVRIKTFIDEPGVEVKKIDELVAKAIIDGTDFSFDGLLNRGLITIDQLANYINNVGNADYFALLLQTDISIYNSANILNSPNISASRINEILKSVNITADRVKSILLKMLDLGYYERLIDIITYNASNVTLTNDTTYTGVLMFRNLDLNGYNYIAGGQPHVIIAYSINIPSTSKISKTATGGAGSTDQGGPGVANVNIGDSYTSKGGSGGSGSYSGGGGGPNGPGGSGIERGFPGGPITVNTVDLLKTNTYALVDWYIVNVLGKTPSSTTSFISSYNAGGGGGAGLGGIGGSGGNGGGGLIIFCNILNCSGYIQALGNNGGTRSNAAGGGGGGGGIIYIYASTITCNSINVAGGNGGNGTDGYGGGGGAGGIVYVFYRNSYSISTINVSGGAGGSPYGGSGQPGFYRIIKF